MCENLVRIGFQELSWAQKKKKSQTEGNVICVLFGRIIIIITMIIIIIAATTNRNNQYMLSYIFSRDNRENYLAYNKITCRKPA